MKIITIGNTKGGVGKSTVTTNLAVELAARGKKVCIIDADIQGSASAFREIRQQDDITALAITTPTIHKDVPGMKGYDLILIDAGGRDSKVFRSAVVAADFFVLPVVPSVFDVWATQDTIEVLKEAKVTKEITARILMNQLVPKTIMARETFQALKEFEEDAPMLQASLSSRSAYRNAILKGQGVVEFEPRGKAAGEVRAVVDEILKLTKGVR